MVQEGWWCVVIEASVAVVVVLVVGRRGRGVIEASELVVVMGLLGGREGVEVAYNHGTALTVAWA